MALIKIKLGELIEQTFNRNENLTFGEKDVMGMTIYKTVIPTKADVNGADLKKYFIVNPNEFIYNPRTHGKKIGLGFNNMGKAFIISWNNIAFKIKDIAKSKIMPEYLYMIFNRSEWDRKACYDSWGSSTEVFSWNALCDMIIDLPDLQTQEKFVQVYQSMVENQKAYERGLEDLKLVCDGYIEDLRRNMPSEEIGSYIQEVSNKNLNNKLSAENIKGISINKEFIETKADTNGVNTSNYKIVSYNEFAFNPNTARMGDKICIALNDTQDRYLVSAIYPTFKIDEKKLIPEYLMLFFCREEFDRYVRFNSWGSARETFNYTDIKEVEIPIPELEKQQSIVHIYKSYTDRKEINERLKQQIKDICPILIKGSIVEGV